MSTTYSAGIATAYGAAVRGGYTGTYAEWCALMADYGNVGQRAEQAAEEAAASASAASTSETNAANSKTSASQSATAAAASATQAASSASAASASKTNAATSATNAASSANSASESATAAAGSASGASNSAAAAAASAAAAEAFAHAVSYEEQTLTDSQKAQARENIGAADAAEVSELQSETSDLETYVRSMSPLMTPAPSPVVSVADAAPIDAEDVTVAVEPVQDLHGQDAPYLAGATKNLFLSTPYAGLYNANSGSNLKTGAGIPYAITSDGRIQFAFADGWTGRLFATDALAAGQYTIRIYSNSTTIRATSYITDGDLVTVSLIRNYSSNGYSAIETITVNEGQRIALAISGSTAGTIITAFQVESGTTATDQVPFENICPISGWTEATASRVRKNLLNPDVSAWSVSGGSYAFIGGVVPKKAIAIMSFTDKDTSVDVSDISIGFVNNDTSKGAAAESYRWVMQNGTVSSNTTNIVTIGASIFMCGNVMVYPKSADAVTRIFQRWNIQVELGSTASPYEPYVGQTYSVDWTDEAGTVYGGTLDLTAGTLTVNKAMVLVGTSTGSLVQNGKTTISTKAYFVPTTAKLPGLTGFISDKFYIVRSGEYVGQMTGRATIGGVEFSLPLTVENTDEAVREWFVNNPTQLCYPLATPVTYTLDPVTLTLLRGNNTVWADTGDTTLAYRVDLPTYIDERTRETRSMIAGIETSMTATRAYSAGDLLIVGDTLYKATTAIANGAAFTPGTNVTATTVAEQLILLANA